MRLPEAGVEMINRAMNLRGCSRTDFVCGAAVRVIEEVVMEQELVRMSPQGFAHFMDIPFHGHTGVSRRSGTGDDGIVEATRAVGARLRSETATPCHCSRCFQTNRCLTIG